VQTAATGEILRSTERILVSPPISDKIVMWRFLRNRRLLLCLHTIIFRALIYWAHRAVILAIAWHLVFLGHGVHCNKCKYHAEDQPTQNPTKLT